MLQYKKPNKKYTMPRKPRIDLAGYHHVINRGVNRSEVFVDDDDYEVFLKIKLGVRR